MTHPPEDRHAPGPPPRVLAISGSLRRQSLNSVIIESAALIAAPRLRLEIYQGLGDLPHFNPDRDGPEAPAPVRELRERIVSADALLISCPEYAHGVPGVLKNALDWLVSGVEIVALPIGIVNGTPRATHAVASLAETLRTMSASVVPEASRSLPLVGRALTPDQFLAEPALAEELRGVLDALHQAVRLARAEGRRLVPRPVDAAGVVTPSAT